MTIKTVIAELETLDPCSEGLEWARQQTSAATGWDKCERSDWMIWYLRKRNLIDKPTSVRLACAFAKRVLHIFERKYPKDMRPREAIEAALAYLENPTEEMRQKCRNAAATAAAADAYATAAATAAADAYATAAATAAADAAADAYADADAYAATAAAYAAYAADAAAYAAAYAADADARKTERKWQAEQIRLIIPNPFKAKKKGGGWSGICQRVKKSKPPHGLNKPAPAISKAKGTP